MSCQPAAANLSSLLDEEIGMKKWIGVAVLAVVASSALADSRVQLPDGRECWMNRDGHVYGCVNTRPTVEPRSGSVYAPAGQGYVGTDGRYYAPAGPNAVVDPRAGQVIPIGR